MCSDHSTTVPRKSATHHSGDALHGRKPHSEPKSIESHSLDLEKEGMAIPATFGPPMLDLSHYKLVEEVWHYCSVDWSDKCMGTIRFLMSRLTA